MSSSLSPEEDTQLVANGYEPLPVQGKRPVMREWGSLDISLLPKQRKAYPDAKSTGLRTKYLPGIDIDIKDYKTAVVFAVLAQEFLGPTPLKRVGAKGMMLVYRTAVPFRKVIISTKGEEKIEVLAEGQQFVAFGIHPDTKLAYRWIGCDEFDAPATPLTVPRDLLPEITYEQVKEFAQAAATKFTELGYEDVKVNIHVSDAKKREAGAKEDLPINIEEATAYVKNLTDRGRVAEGKRNDTIFKLATRMRDKWYLSPGRIRDMIIPYAAECMPGFEGDDVLDPIKHGVGDDTDATSYMQNEPGANVRLPATQAFAGIALDKLSAAIEGAPAGADLTGQDEYAPKNLVFTDDNYSVGWKGIRASTFINQPVPPLREIVPVWVERNKNTMIEGPPGTHKSRALLQDGICIQAGLPVMGEKVERCEVLYMNWENEEAEMQRRTIAIRAFLRRDNTMDPINLDGLEINNLRGHNRMKLISVTREGPMITRFGQEFLQQMAVRRDTIGHTLVIMDGLMHAISFGDNTRNDDNVAQGILQMLDDWCSEYDMSIQSMVHPGRTAERSNSAGSYAMAWTANPRCIQTFTKVLDPYKFGPKAKITKLTPREDLRMERYVQKRSNGIDGQMVLLEYRKGGMVPHPPPRVGRTPDAAPEEPIEQLSDESEL